MKTYKFKPKSLDENKLEGFVEIQLLKQSEKLKLLHKCQFKLKEDNTIDKMDQMLQMAEMIEASEPYVKQVVIESQENKEIKFNSFDDLQYGTHPACAAILSEISAAVIQGPGISGN